MATSPFITSVQADKKIQDSYNALEQQIDSENAGSDLGLLKLTDTPPPTGKHRGDVQTAGTYTNFGGIVFTQLELDNNYGYIYVEEGVSSKVLSKKAIPDISSKVDKSELSYVSNENLASPEFILNDTYVANVTGALQNIAGYKTMKISNLVPGQKISFGNFTIDSQGNYSFYNGNTLHSFGGTYINSGLPKQNITVPVGADTMYIAIARAINVLDDYKNTMVNIGATLLPYVTPLLTVSKIIGKDIQAKKISPDNVTPDPITDLNAVNKKYFDLNSLKVSDLELSMPENLATSDNIISDKFIGSSGLISDGSGWKMIKIPVITGQKISFGNFLIYNIGYYSFFNGDTSLGPMPSYDNSTLPKENITVPPGANFLYFDILRPGGVADFDKVMANIGETLLPYSDPKKYIEKIKGYDVKGGSGGDIPSNVAILDTDVSFSNIVTAGLTLDLPSGTSEPVGLNIGDAWVDTTNGNLKVKL